jgi:hypothetical protein
VAFPIYTNGAGRVGVDTKDPEETLDVAGNVRAEQLVLHLVGTAGEDTNPAAKLVLQNAGINRVELALYMYSQETGQYDKVAGTEITGTTASVRDGLLGSHFECFRRDGAVHPIARIVNSSPVATIELAAVGGQVAAGGMSRSGTTVTVNTVDSNGDAIAHGFGQGQSITLWPGETDFPSGTKVLASVSTNSFTYTEAGDEGSSTGAHDVSAAWDMGIKHAGYQEMAFVIGGSTKFSIFADTVRVESGIRFTANGPMRVETTDLSGTPGAGTANTTTGLFAFAAGTGASGIVITDSRIGTSPVPRIFATVQSNDATCKSVACVPNPAGGSFTAYANANATGITKVAFWVLS